MLDDLRDDAGYMDEDEEDFESQKAATSPQSQFLGMTPVQRFVIALMVFMMVCILGSFFLIITETVWPPF